MIATTRQRDLSLDAFRGIDVLLMIIVNLQGSDDAAFALLKHAQWHGLTLADLVFPIFLLIVGLSVPLALDRRGVGVDWAAIVRRAALLFIIGVGLSWLIRPTLDPDAIRWTGVLQRIAVVYLVCAIVVAARRGVGLAAGIAVGLLVLHSGMILMLGAPGGGVASLAPGGGISGWMDQTFIPGRVLRQTWDPEGVLSTLPAIANGLIGVSIMRLMRERGAGNPLLAVAGIGLLIAGLGLAAVIPLNKNLWTASFTLTTCGVGVLVWLGMRLVWGAVGGSRVARWAVSLGQAALTLYIVHTLLIAVIVRKLPNGDRIWDGLYEMIAATRMAPPVAALLFAIIGAALSCAVLPPLKRRGWILKV